MIAIVERILSGDDPEIMALAAAEVNSMGTGPGGGGGHKGGGADGINPFGLSQAAVMRFIKMVSLMMADQLRTSVLSSINACCKFWQQYDITPGDEHAVAGYPYNNGALVSGRFGSGRTSGIVALNGNSAPATESANVWFRSTHPELSKWGEDLHTAWPPPLLLVALQVRLLIAPGMLHPVVVKPGHSALVIAAAFWGGRLFTHLI